MKTSGSSSTPQEIGWLPDYVFTGGRFEPGLAFFADPLGRITRFSRAPADLASARRLGGQAALPGLVNTHARTLLRLGRGRGAGGARAACDRIATQLTTEDVYDAARLALLEMLLGGTTCVGEFCVAPLRAAGDAWSDPNAPAHAVLRAARDTGIRLALHKVVDAGTAGDAATIAQQFIRETDALREHVGREHPGDETWLGVGVASVGAVPPDALRAISAYAHAQRFRLQMPVAERRADVEAWRTATGRAPIAWLAEHGIIDKRFTAIHAATLGDDEVNVLGAARAAVCACPTSAFVSGAELPAAEKLQAAGVTFSFGTGDQEQASVLQEARTLAQAANASRAVTAEHIAAWWLAATAGGARSLGAPSGALEVGRPADFFTVNLFDPSLVGAEPAGLLASVLGALERRAIRDVWIGARQRVSAGRHVQQGTIVGRFADLQRRLWGA